MALPQRARPVRSNKRPPPTPLVQPREQRDVLVEAIETAHYRLEPFAPLPVNVAEAFSRSPATLSSSRIDEDWAFAICGRFVFVWRLAEVKARPLPAISRELPPSSQPITARNVAFLRCANANSRGLAVVTAEGHIRLWPDVEAAAVHEATVQLDAQAHVTSLTAKSEPLSGAIGCSSGAVYLLQAQGYVQLTPLTRPKGMLAGIGSLLGWGRGQSQPASLHPISALVAQQSNLFVLTAGALQRWHGSTVVFEFPLQTAVENWLRDETISDAMDASGAQVGYKVWLLRMVPGVPGETVHVLVASINALCPPDRLPILSFAVAEVDFSSTPVQLAALRAVQPSEAPLIYDRRTEAEQLASVDFIATQHSLAALMTSSRVLLFRLAHADPELDVVGAMKADDAPLGGGPLGQRLALMSARGVRLATSRVSAAPPSSLPLRRFNNLAAGLDAALSGSPAVYDGPVIEQDLIQEIVARIATQASGGQEPSLLIRQQLEEKRAKFNAMFNMLTESLVWRSLSPAGARRLLDIGEQLDASVGLRSFQNNSTAKPDDQINDVFLKAMQHCVLQSRLVPVDRLHSSSVQDVFYAEFARLGDVIDSLAAVCSASPPPPARRDAVDQARTLRAALAILQVLLSSARKFRENPRHQVAYQTAAKESGWLFRDALRENTKRIVLMGLDALADVARSTNADVAGIAADLADNAKDVAYFTLAFHEDQVRADNGASEQLANNWVAERFRFIQPFIEKGLPDRARDLAERFTDFECLIQLSIDAPAPEVGPAPPTLIEYADRYQGHGFVEYLLRYLLTHSRPADILVVGFRFPERFAAWLKDTRRRPEEAAVVQRLGWLLGWQQGDFGRSSLELSQLAAAEEAAGNKGTLLRKKTLASLAVLSALAGGDKAAQEVAARHVDLVDRQERVLGRPATAAPLAAADVIAALLATTREVASADRTERLRIAAEAFARHCSLSSHQSLWTMMWNEILNDQLVNWAAVGARYQGGASDATFESAVRESALFQILHEDFVRERQLLEAENFEKLLAMRQPDERGALRRTYQLALSSRMMQ